MWCGAELRREDRRARGEGGSEVVMVASVGEGIGTPVEW